MLESKHVHDAEKEGDWRGKPFILTYTGKIFPYDCFTEECIDIRDIAHALAHLCRYTGHTNMFFSVAQHSLLVSEKIQGDARVKLTALLHDAAEAYTNDLASPLKKWLNDNEEFGSAYGCLQDSIAAAIYTKFGITKISSDIRMYDMAAGVFEAEAFMGLTIADLQHYQFPMEVRGLWQPWLPQGFGGLNSDREFGDVETEFLTRFENLMEQCGMEP